MKNIVYLIKVKREKFPNRYIGSKSNCKIIDGKIYDYRNKIYIGSARDKQYKSIVEYSDYEVQILGEFDSYEECLSFEKQTHLANDVVASPKYFNKAIATENNFGNPDYASYKNLESGKTARLRRDHPKVINGEWVGVTYGTKLTEEERKKRGRSGKENGFWGRTHSEETKIKSGKKIGDAHRGKPKTDEQRRKMSEARKRWWAKRKKSEENKICR